MNDRIRSPATASFWRGAIMGCALGLLSLASTGARAVAPGSITAPPDTTAVYAAIERGRQALIAEKYPDATKALDEALQKPEFATLPKSDQYRTFLFASIAAQGREDYLGAHEFTVIATSYPDADQHVWIMRTRYAYWMDNYADAAKSLTTIAKQWPKSLEEIGDRTVGHIVHELGEDKKLAAEQLELIQALFGAGFTNEWEMQPSTMWRELVLDALQHKDLKRAREVLKRINGVNTLINMRTDRRYDEIVQMEPKAFDVAAAAHAACKRWRQIVDANPRKLGPIVQYMYALLAVGSFQEVVTLSDRTLAKQAKGTREKPAFDDEADKLNWIHDLKASGLDGLGRWDEALAVQQKARDLREASEDKVSQAINLGSTYTTRNQPELALKSLEGIDWANSLSGYGRMQLQHVRLRAYLELGNRAEAEKVFVYMRENKNDAPDNWQVAMLDWGDLDGAAAQYIARLRDPKERPEALYAAQNFLDEPRMPKEAESHAQWQALLARADVSAAIAEVGRRERQPVHECGAQ